MKVKGMAIIRESHVFCFIRMFKCDKLNSGAKKRLFTKERIMIMDNRENIINLLAASMGVGELGSTKYEESRYDASTGTLYCNGMAISKNTADKAMRYFEQMEKKCSMDDPSGREMAMIYRCGIEAIRMMRAEQIKDLIKEEAAKL